MISPGARTRHSPPSAWRKARLGVGSDDDAAALRGSNCSAALEAKARQRRQIGNRNAAARSGVADALGDGGIAQVTPRGALGLEPAA